MSIRNWACAFMACAMGQAELVYPAAASKLQPITGLSAEPGVVAVLHPTELAISSDAGNSWVRKPVPENPRGIHFRDAMHGCLAAEDGIYLSDNGGTKWRRVKKSRDVTNCHFVSESLGFAVGERKTALVTRDGGKSWQALEPATGVLSDPERTTFTGIWFSGKTGFIAGYHSPKRPSMDAAGRQWPQLGIVVQTIDGGETWKPSSSAVFGRLEQMAVWGRTAAMRLGFDFDFEWPSEAYAIDLPTGKTERSYREADRRVCSVAVLPGGEVASAAVRWRRGQEEGPRPMELRVDGDLVRLDERMTGSRCFLEQDGTHVWLATAEGLMERFE